MAFGLKPPAGYLLGISLVSLSLAACYQSVWKADYSSGIENARNYSITSTTDNAGNLLVGGASTVAITQDDQGNDIVHYQPVLLKYDASGNLQWQFEFDNGGRRTVRYGYQGGAEISQVITAADASIYAAGIVPGANFATDDDDFDLAVFKLDATGNLLWSRVIEQPTLDSPLALGISTSGKLLVAVGHTDFETNSSSSEAMALSTADGSTLWYHDEPNTEDSRHLYLYNYSENPLLSNAAAAGTDRIAVTRDRNRVSVYSESGALLFELADPDTSAAGTDVGPACTPGDNPMQARVDSVTFDNQNMVVLRSNTYFGCSFSFSSIGIARYDSSGMESWHTALTDESGSEYPADFLAYFDDHSKSFLPFTHPALHHGSALKTSASHIFVASTLANDYHTKTLGDYPAVSVDTLMFALDKAGQILWQKNLGTRPSVKSKTDVSATWTLGHAMALTAQGKPVLALNEMRVDGRAYFLGNLEESTFSSVRSQLVEFDPATGETDFFGTENDQIVRSLTPGNSNGVFKVGDNQPSVPLWWFTSPTDIPYPSAAMHISYYRSR